MKMTYYESMRGPKQGGCLFWAVPSPFLFRCLSINCDETDNIKQSRTLCRQVGKIKEVPVVPLKKKSRPLREATWRTVWPERATKTIYLRRVTKQSKSQAYTKSNQCWSTYRLLSKWFEPRSISSSYCVLVWVSVVLKTIVVVDWRFHNLSGSHLQSQVSSICQSMML